MNSERDLDLVLDFAGGLLTREEMKSMLERAKRDAEFERLLRTQIGEHRRLETLTPEATVEASSHRARMPAPRRGKFRRSLAWGAGVAAAAIILFMLLPREAEPTPPWIPLQESLVQTRGAAGDERERLAEGLRAYERRDSEQAVRLLAEFTAGEGYEDLRRLYLASALLHEGELERARETLRALDPESLPPPWRDHALAALDYARARLGSD